MSEIISILANSDCSQIGGQEKAYAVGFDKIDTVAITNGVITGFTMTEAGLWGQLTFDDNDNVAFFNETGEEVGQQVRFNGEGLMKFSGITQNKITAANKAKDCCGVVVVWFSNDGTKRVQGIDVAPDDTWSFSQKKARIVPNVISDTGDNEARVEYGVTHVGRYASATTSLSAEDIEAL